MVLNAALWSMAGVVSLQFQSTAFFEVTFWRSLFTFFALALALPMMLGPRFWHSVRHAGISLWLSGLCWAVMFTAFTLALSMTSVANVLITLSLGPFLTALLARVVNRQRVARHTWVAIGLAGLGIVWMFLPQMNDRGVRGGMALALAVPLASAVHWTLIQRSQLAGKSIDFTPAVLIGAFISCVSSLPVAWPLQGTGQDVAWLAFLGVFQLALPCIMAVWCAKVLHPAKITLLALLEVVFGIALVWCFTGIKPEAYVWSGGVLVLLALIGNEWLAWQKEVRRARRVTA